MPQSLKIMGLNAGRLLQERTREYLKNLAINPESAPDVLCLQDFPFRDLGLLEWAPHIAFAPMTNHLINGERAVVGIAIASRYFMTDIAHCTTWGNGILKNLEGVDDKNRRYLGVESDALVEATEDRVAICATVIKDGARFDVATAHGMWVRGGVVNDIQRQSTGRLLHFLDKERSRRKGLVLAGDLNIGRGGEIYQMFVKKGFHDCVPDKIDNTLDPDHPSVRNGLKVVIDYIMTYGADLFGDVYSVSEVMLLSGVSDHCALSATVART